MLDDENELQMDFLLDQTVAEGHDMMGFGPLLPTESERSRIEDFKEEILRKRRAGKLQGDTTSMLKNWWQQHAKWPYPTVVPMAYTFMPFGSGTHDYPRNELEIDILILHSLAIFERKEKEGNAWFWFILLNQRKGRNHGFGDVGS
ncbi:Homeobox protein HD1 [Camellia lanceoleosa]|uniref:Homeobox protein HD1 n=1 Tax=Camellia lanceoleosa TaxID=1840588 RepID=A0ACC0F9T2_9ERIC|nr:Homeobox protein HD1 [Camellia lanceoleosa]